MLTMNSHLDKLAAAQVDFPSPGMLEGMVLDDVPPAPAATRTLSDDNDDEGVNDSHIIESHVKLSKTPCECLSIHAYYTNYYSHSVN